MPEEDVFTRITQKYYQLTASEKKLANYIMANGQNAQNMSITELAATCGVAEATISRFCRRMEYGGFIAFRVALATATASRTDPRMLSGSIQADDSVPELCSKLASIDISAIHETKALIEPEAIRTAADLLLAADKVFCMGQGGSMLLAEEAAHLFTTVFSGFFPVRDSHMQVITASSLCKKDVILFFSYSGSTKDLMDVLRIAQKRSTKVILITRFLCSPGAGLADCVLQCGTTENPLQLGSVAARIAQLYLIDVLFSEMCRRDLEGCGHQRERIADALSDKHL